MFSQENMKELPQLLSIYFRISILPTEAISVNNKLLARVVLVNEMNTQRKSAVGFAYALPVGWDEFGLAISCPCCWQ